MKTLTLRLKPGQKIKQTLKNIAKEKQIKGGFIITGLGSLSSMDIRYANNGKETLKGPFEIVSLVGTLSQDGCHTHISLGDSKGKTISERSDCFNYCGNCSRTYREVTVF